MNKKKIFISFFFCSSLVFSIFAQDSTKYVKNTISTSLIDFLARRTANIGYERSLCKHFSLSSWLAIYIPQNDNKLHARAFAFEFSPRFYFNKQNKGVYTSLGYQYGEFNSYGYNCDVMQIDSVDKSGNTYNLGKYPSNRENLTSNYKYFFRNETVVRNQLLNFRIGYKAQTKGKIKITFDTYFISNFLTITTTKDNIFSDQVIIGGTTYNLFYEKTYFADLDMLENMGRMFYTISTSLRFDLGIAF